MDTEEENFAVSRFSDDEDSSVKLDAKAEEGQSILYKQIGQESFANVTKINVTAKWIASATTFTADICEADLAELEFVRGLQPDLIKAVRRNIKRWFPVQKCVIPYLVNESNFCNVFPSRDVAISAPTGSGKTLCYILPIINALRQFNRAYVFAIIIAPVQNLAQQIEREFQKYNVYDIACALLCGNQDYTSERRQFLDSNNHCKASVLIATPGRLVEHLLDPSGTIDISKLRYLVVDEADRMSQDARLEWLDLLEGAADANGNWNCVTDCLSGSRLQKILVSATLSRDVEKLHMWRLRYPRLFRADAMMADVVLSDYCGNNDQIENSIALPHQLEYAILTCTAQEKPLAVYFQLKIRQDWKKVLVFTNQKVASYRLSVLLQSLCKGQYVVEYLSSDLCGRRRMKVLSRFFEGDTRVLICSDAVSRGMDFCHVEGVINYDVPQTQRLFVHRAGRTARAGQPGTVISIVTEEEKYRMIMILKTNNCLDRVREIQLAKEEVNSLLPEYRQSLSDLRNKMEKGRMEVRNNLSKRRFEKTSAQYLSMK